MGPVNHSDNAEIPPTEPRSFMSERLSSEKLFYFGVLR